MPPAPTPRTVQRANLHDAAFAGCYVAIENHVDVKGPLQKIGLLSSELLPLSRGNPLRSMPGSLDTCLH